MKRIISLILVTCSALLLWAENEDNQVLVFRNTGEVNLFYASELDTIFCSHLDTAGVEYDSVVSQVFVSKDTTMLVPVSEIDSVVFGNRNEIVFQPNVHILTAEDTVWIIRVDGTAIYYKINTPSTSLPVVGQVLYYPNMDELFPNGLAAKVISVSQQGQEIKVSIEQASYEEIFERFFYAGEIASSPVTSSQRKVDVTANIKLRHQLEVGDYGTFSVVGDITAKGTVVLNPFRHYYHASLQMNIPLGMNANIGTQDKYKKTFEKEFLHINLPNVAYIFVPTITCGVFCEVSAEAGVNYSMNRTFTYDVDWTRQDGVDQLTFPTRAKESNNQDTAKAEITLDGSIYMGIVSGVEFNLIGDIVGARADVKVGPQLSGNLSFGVLSNMHEYNPTIYANAQLSLQGLARLSGIVSFRDWLKGGEIRKETLITVDVPFLSRTLNCFPHFEHTAAVMQPKKAEITLSAATKVKEELVYPVETGFEVLKNEQVVDSIFVDSIKANTDKLQGVQTNWTASGAISPNDSLRLRPVFHYAGHTIAYADIAVAQNPNFLPYITHMSNGHTTIISGAPIIGQAKSDSTTIVVGNYLPIPHIDTFFVKDNPFINPIPAPIADPTSLIGIWTGLIDAIQTSITFNQDSTGTWQQGAVTMNFTFEINSPQMGDLTITFEDKSTRIFRILSLNGTTLTIWDKQKRLNYSLSK